nr:hypothetical protein CFP56_07942 [Quercus suber]
MPAATTKHGKSKSDVDLEIALDIGRKSTNSMPREDRGLLIVNLVLRDVAEVAVMQQQTLYDRRDPAWKILDRGFLGQELTWLHASTLWVTQQTPHPVVWWRVG